MDDANTQASMQTHHYFQWSALSAALALTAFLGCSSDAKDLPQTGVPAGGGGTALAGSGAGGAATPAGSAAFGGSASGGIAGSPLGAGGVSTGGVAAGGVAAGGLAAGGVAVGGTAGSSAGTTAGGADGCPGVPILPDPGGYVSLASNTLGINGSWFYYSDCVDKKGVDCATQIAPPKGPMFPNVGGRMCTSGSTSTANGAWGAGLGFELNDIKGQQPYDAVAHGVKGFCIKLSGPTLPAGTGVRIAFTTKGIPDDAYFSAATTPGVHPVLFKDTAQGSWVKTKTPFDLTQVMLLQIQIPSSTTAPVPWDFCVDQLTAIVE